MLWFYIDIVSSCIQVYESCLAQDEVSYALNVIEALQFTPRLKGVLSRILPILGNIRDPHRPIFANGIFLLP